MKMGDDKDNCGLCKLSEEDDGDLGESWIECSKCKQWFHTRCLKMEKVPDESIAWFCSMCADPLVNDNGKASDGAVSTNNGDISNGTNNVGAEFQNGYESSDLCKDKNESEDTCEREKFKLMSELIKEREEVIALKQKQLDLMEKMSDRDKGAKAEHWISSLPSTSKNTSHEIKHGRKNMLRASENNNGGKLVNCEGAIKVEKFRSGSHLRGDKGASSINDDKYDVSWLMKKQMQLISQQYLADLPDFDGDAEMWPIFYQQFVSTTVQGCFDDAFNLMRLRKSLKGEARQSVIGILAMPDCLNDVMNILEKRFGNSEVIVKKKIRKLSTLPPPVENKPQTIKVFYEFILGLYATLKNANAVNYLQSPQTLDTIIEKLPVGLVRSWLRHKRNLGNPTIENFIEWFEPFYDCANECDVMSKVEQPKKNDGRVNIHKEADDQNVKANKEPTNSANKPTESKKCSVCKRGQHSLDECDTFKKLQSWKKWSFVRSRRLCFKCLKGKHRYENCTSGQKCNIDGCSEFHHALLHATRPKSNGTVHVESSSSAEAEMNAVVSTSEKSLTHFRSLPVTISNPENGKSIVVWAFIDEGSSPTMLSNDVANELELNGEYDELCTTWTDDSVRKEPNSRRVKLMISGVGVTKQFSLNNVRTVSCLKLPLPTTTQDVIQKFEHLRDLHIADVPLSRPKLLIGLEHAKLGLMYEIREGKWNEPIGTRTRLGWVVHGKQVEQGVEKPNQYSCHVCECNSNDNVLSNLMRDFQTTEAFGVKAVERLVEAKDDIRARKLLEETTKKVERQYETGLLWKRDDVHLPDNKRMAIKRLLCFEQKLKRDENLKATVMSKMSEHISNGYLERVTSDLSNKRHWFLPVFSVVNPNKPTKVRIVFDAAANIDGTCLNDMLLKGPETIASLIGVIFRFRQRKIAVSADIAEMFHRIKIIEADQMCQLVLWRNCDEASPVKIYKMTRMTFGASCSPCSATYVLRENANQFSVQHPRAVESIRENHYVDDLLDSFDSEDEALEISRQIHFIHEEGGFLIRNWISNSRQVANEMNRRATNELIDLNMNVSEETSTEKVLGMFWSTITDQFLFKLNVKSVDAAIINKLRLPTKREMLKIMMSQFDPLGILSPIIIHAKIIMQYVWKSGVEWDEKIPGHLQEKWFSWLDSLERIQMVRVDRWYFQVNGDPREKIILHMFADASEEAFASIAFLQIRYVNKRCVSFVAAKSRVAPQKSLSIPRLELQAAVMSTRLKDTIIKELSITIDQVMMWTDSQTVLSWIRSTKRRYSAFVSHRISEILDSTTISQWRWVPSGDNVADQATRISENPSISETWLNGPEFLAKSVESWPIDKNFVSTDEELKHVHIHNETKRTCSLIDYAKFSKWERLLRCAAYVKRYIHQLKVRRNSPVKMRQQSIAELIATIPPLTAEELHDAEEMLFRMVQSESYGPEIQSLNQSEKQVSKKSPLYNLNPVIDGNGVVRLATRIDVAPAIVSQSIRQPIVLNQDHWITNLLIDATHRKFQHMNKEAVVNHLRQYVWIPKIRIQVNRVVRKCCFCIQRLAKPKPPKMAALPEGRVSPFQPVFSFTGLDYFGPIEITVGRRHEKRWGVLFVCLSTRAIHMELAATLDTSSAIMCVRNFNNRRGPAVEMISDNGTNLRAAEKELRNAVEEIDVVRLQDESMQHLPHETRTKWRFNPPSAPHFGGSWERMIQTVKKSLYIVLKEKYPREETLRSALIEVENLVNSRPLYYVPNDVDNMEAITPNHLLKGTFRHVIQFDGDYDCRKQWKKSQSLATEFWKRWLKEYLPTISTRPKWNDEVDAVKIGQLVLIVDESLKRGEWKKGIISNVYPSRDGKIRKAEVKTVSSTYIRPVAKLAVLNIGAAL